MLFCICVCNVQYFELSRINSLQKIIRRTNTGLSIWVFIIKHACHFCWNMISFARRCSVYSSVEYSWIYTRMKNNSLSCDMATANPVAGLQLMVKCELVNYVQRITCQKLYACHPGVWLIDKWRNWRERERNLQTRAQRFWLSIIDDTEKMSTSLYNFMNKSI